MPSKNAILAAFSKESCETWVSNRKRLKQKAQIIFHIELRTKIHPRVCQLFSESFGGLAIYYCGYISIVLPDKRLQENLLHWSLSGKKRKSAVFAVAILRTLCHIISYLHFVQRCAR